MSTIVHIFNIISGLLPSSFFSIRKYLLVKAGCKIGESVCLNHRVKVYGNAVIIGDYTWISSGSIILSSYNNSESIIIGKNCDIGPEVLLVTGTHEIGDQVRRAGKGLCLPIIIGEGTWIGARATILGGVTIGKGSIIAAGSVVLPGLYPDNCFLAGIPAVIKKHFE